MKHFIWILLVTLGISGGAASGANIYVTTVLDKVSTTGGCSLKEAMYSANLGVNKAYSDVFGLITTIIHLRASGRMAVFRQICVTATFVVETH